MMDVMWLIDIVILLFGFYMIWMAFKMKQSGEISSAVITAEEIAACRDKKGFISFMYWREALFGAIMALTGALGLINELAVSLGKFNLVEMVIFLAAFLWFQHGLREARERFLRKF